MVHVLQHGQAKRSIIITRTEYALEKKLKDLIYLSLPEEAHLKHMNLIVLFVVGYSGNCQFVELTLKGITNGLSDNVVVYRLDAKKNPEAVSDYGIREYPTILFFKNGLIVDHHTGLISKRELYTKVLRFIKLNSENKSINN